MTSIIEHIDDLELEVTFFGEVTTEQTGEDGGEWCGATYLPTIQSYYVVEDIQFEKVDDEYADRVQTWVSDNYDDIEAKIIKEYSGK